MDEREIEIRAEMLTCKHFNGIGGFLPIGEDGQARWNDAKTCEAGVCYRTLVGGDDKGWASALPCNTNRFNQPKGARPTVACERFEAPTFDEAALEIDARNAHIKDVLAKIEAGEDVPGVIVCGRRSEPDGKECPQSVDGKCPSCGASDLMPIYGLGSGYGGIGGYNVCHAEDGTGCGEVCDFVEDTEDGDDFEEAVE